MELSQEKKTQIAVCHGKGMTVKEIAKTANLTEAQVDVFLQSIGKQPLYRRYSQPKKEIKYNKYSEEAKQQMFKLLQEGKGITEISKITGINIKTVTYYKRKTKEKEPATAATVTDSVSPDVKTDVCDTVSISNDNTGNAKCQVLLKYIKRDLYGIYEKLSQAERNAWDLGEMYARVTDHLKEVVGE